MIIFDSNYLCYRAYFSHGELEHKGDKTGIMYGFLYDVMRVLRRFRTKPVIFTWDSKENHRKQFYTPYKKGRKSKLTEDDYIQFDILRETILPQMGFKNIFIKNGLEADDLIASICKLNIYTPKIIVSSDTDLYQLLNETTSMYPPSKKKLYTQADFEAEWGIVPALWAAAKAIAGCSTDNIQGVAGVAEKTAIKYLKKELNKKSKAYEELSRKNSERLYLRNMLLVKLPLDGESLILKTKKDHLSYDRFYSICVDYGFYSIINEMKEWRKAFKLK